MGNKPSLPQIRKDVILQRDQSLERYVPIFRKIIDQSTRSPQNVELIINGDLPSLVQRLNNREVTSLELVAIYGLRAATIGRKLSCITEDYFQYALGKAKQCDEIRSKSNKKNWTLNDQYDQEKYLPPLFGVPISIKDNIEMQGTRATMGLTLRAIIKHEKDSIIPTCVKNSGMIPFVKSNIPQICMTYDSNNFLWGRCLNPWNQKKSAGGSSGGEGALIAAKISPIGIGNDILGSVRIPAAFNGVVGLMSSTGRLPITNTATFFSHSFAGMDLIKIVTGPLAQTVDGAALWMKVMTNQSFYAGKHDPYIKLIPFDEKVYNETFTSKKKIKIGYFDSLEMIEASPSMVRGVTQTVEFLKSEGHELVEISLPFERQLVFAPFTEVVGEGGMKTFLEAAQGEQIIDEYSNLKRISTMNPYLLAILKYLMRKLQPRVGMVLDAAAKIDTHQYLQKTGRSHELRTQWINYWRKNQLDFVICPGFGIPAADKGFAKECDLVAAYTYIWNVLAMASCSLPVTITREDEQYYQSHWEDDFTKAIKKTISTSAGLPVNVQIVGLPFSEERVLGLAKKIEKHFQFRQKHPYPNYEPQL